MDNKLKNSLEYLKKGIATDSFTEGMEKKLITMVLRMHDKNYTVEQIVDVTDESPERIKEILEGKTENM